MEIKIGDRFIATQVDQTIEIKDILEKTKSNGKSRLVMIVEIIRNNFPGIFELDYDISVPGLLNPDLYESF